MEQSVIELRDYQHYGAYYLARRPGAILGDEVGLGKTFQAIQAALLVKARTILVIMPKVLKEQWAGEIVKLVPDAHVLGLVKADEWDFYHKGTGPRFVLAHYEQFRDGETRTLQVNGKDKKVIMPSEITGYILATKWDAVIADEVHKIKNPKAQRSYWLTQLQARYKWGLTGTPVAEHPDDLWHLLHWVSPQEFQSYWNFVETYCRLDRYKKVSGLLPPRARTLQLLRDRTKHLLLVRHLEDVGVELPEMREVNVPIKFDPVLQAFYEQIKKDVIIRLIEDQGDPDVWDLTTTSQLIINTAIARYTRLQQAASAASVFKPGLPNDKLDWLTTYIEGGGEPGVIFTRFRETVAVVTARLAELGATGWKVGTYDTIGTGLNLQHYRVIVAFDAPISWQFWEQARGRLHRLGQERKQIVYRLIGTGTIDEHCWRLIDRKESTNNLIIDWLRGIKEAEYVA